MNKYSIKELDLETIRPNAESIGTSKGGSTIVVIGKRGSGKSLLIKHLLYSKKHIIPVGLVISGTERVNRFYEQIFPDVFIHDEYTPQLLATFVKRQEHAKKYLPNPWLALVLDDCMDDTKLFKEKTFRGLFKNGRHWDVFAIFANQYVLDFGPDLRTNIDGVFIFRETNLANRKKIYENFASIVPTFEIFCKLMDTFTENYQCIYIDNQSNSSNWTDCVFYFKADPDLPSFTFGVSDSLHFAATRTKNRSENQDVENFICRTYYV